MSITKGCFITIIMLIICLMQTSCIIPPYNNFHPSNDKAKATVAGAGIGAIVGGGHAVAGAAIGGAAGAVLGSYHDRDGRIIRTLSQQDIQYIQHGDTMTLIVPTDRYFLFNSARFNDVCYPGLLSIVKLVKKYSCTPIYVAGFTDDVGSKHHQKMLSQARADAMISYLWANEIPAQRLQAEGYGKAYPIGDNNLIRGSAYNRRLEIQWMRCLPPPKIEKKPANWVEK